MALMFCRECGKQVSSEAPACPHCGAPQPVLPALMPEQAPVYYVPAKRPDPTVAALLSLFIPGAGQMYKGDVGIGVGFLLATIVGYVACVFPGIVLHVCSIVYAAQKD